MFWRNDSNEAVDGAVEQALASALPKLEASLRATLRAELEAELRNEQATARAKLDAILHGVRAQIDSDPEARTRLLIASIGEDLRQQVETVEHTLTGLRARLDDLTTLERESVALIEALERRTRPQLVKRAPEQVDLGDLRQAKGFGIVSLWFDGGGTDVVELRVGFDPPPEHVVGKVNTRNKINSAFSTIVRPGEWWTTTTEGSEWGSGVKITYTEFM